MSSLRRGAAALPILLLALTAGCGGSSGGGSSSTASSKSSSSSSASASASASTSSSTAGSGGSSGVVSKIVAAQRKAGSYTFTITTGTAASKTTGKGEADTSTTPASSEVQLAVAGQQIQTISTGGVYYLKSAMFGGDKWVKIDPQASSGLGALLGQLGASDPATALASLTSAAKVTQAGSSQVAGVATTEYDVTVPSSALLKSSAVGAQVQKLLPKTITYQLFVDHSDLLRRITTQLAVSGAQSTTEIDFANYGQKVTITAPPASQVTSAP